MDGVTSAFTVMCEETTTVATTCLGTYTALVQATQLPSGATVDKIEWKTYSRYGYSYSSNPIIADSPLRTVVHFWAQQ